MCEAHTNEANSVKRKSGHTQDRKPTESAGVEGFCSVRNSPVSAEQGTHTPARTRGTCRQREPTGVERQVCEAHTNAENSVKRESGHTQDRKPTESAGVEGFCSVRNSQDEREVR